MRYPQGKSEPGLPLPRKKNYSGAVRKFALANRLEYYEYDLVCKEDFEMGIRTSKDDSIYLCVNLEPEPLPGLKWNENHINIPGFGSFLIYFKDSEILSFEFKAATSYNFLILKAHRSYLGSAQRSFIRMTEENKIFYEQLELKRILIPNLRIIELAKELKTSDKESYHNKFIIRGQANILIGLKLKEFLFRTDRMLKKTTFSSYEILQLKRISNEIRKNPQECYTIKSLCKLSGLSSLKLQMGFKEMHNTTVNCFIRDLRMDKAIELLQDSDLNVSEIVYSVGWNSHSYFCRTFKERYNCSPQAYQKQIKMLERQNSQSPLF